jgi:hypothetical protein
MSCLLLKSLWVVVPLSCSDRVVVVSIARWCDRLGVPAEGGDELGHLAMAAQPSETDADRQALPHHPAGNIAISDFLYDHERTEPSGQERHRGPGQRCEKAIRYPARTACNPDG